MKTKKSIVQRKKRGVISRQQLYSVVSAHSKEAIRRLVQLMNSKNENVALGASKALLSKALPDLKAQELTGGDGEPVKIQLIKDWLYKIE